MRSADTSPNTVMTNVDGGDEQSGRCSEEGAGGGGSSGGIADLVVKEDEIPEVL